MNVCSESPFCLDENDNLLLSSLIVNILFGGNDLSGLVVMSKETVLSWKSNVLSLLKCRFITNSIRLSLASISTDLSVFSVSAIINPMVRIIPLDKINIGQGVCSVP